MSAHKREGARRGIRVASCICTALLFFACAVPAHAAMLITEIMYNPIGANSSHQWIEVTNTGPDAIDLGAKDLRLFDESGNHVISSYDGNTTVLTAGDVAVLAKNPLTFLADYPTFAGIILKSSFSLPSAAGMVGILQTSGGKAFSNSGSSEILDKVQYSASMGANGDGNSLQRVVTSGEGSGGAEIFKSAAPTPGIVPSTLPAPLAAPVKPTTHKTSSTKRASTKHSSSSSLSYKSSSKNSYGNGTDAPPAAANVAAGGALSDFSFPDIFPRIPSLPLFSSPIFAAFLALLAFSSFSLILIERTRPL